MTTARGILTAAHSSHNATVAGSTPSAAHTTNNAASAARRPARTSPTKSAYPGVSIRLILMSPCTSGATDRPTERCWRCAAGSWSLTVVPSVTDPARVITPAAASKASVRVVFPEPDGPTRTMFRTLAGLSTATAAPPSPLSVCLLAIGSPPFRTDGTVCRKLLCSISHLFTSLDNPAAVAGSVRDRLRRSGLTRYPGIGPEERATSHLHSMLGKPRERNERVSDATTSVTPKTGTARVKRGMAEMLKGGVIMDVVTAEQAK